MLVDDARISARAVVVRRVVGVIPARSRGVNEERNGGQSRRIELAAHNIESGDHYVS
jgi:hypothetical protein